MRKLVLPITVAFTVVLLAMLAYGLTQGDPYVLGTEIICIALLWIPPLLARGEVIDLPWPIILGIGAALSLHSFGLVTSLYNTTDWFGYLTHFVSGIVVASLVAVVLVVVIDRDKSLHVPVWWVPFFIFIAVLALEGFWKIFEFTADHTLGTMMQHNLDDTMNDNLSNTVSGIVAGLGTAYYISRTSISHFVEKLNIEKTLARFGKSSDKR